MDVVGRDQAYSEYLQTRSKFGHWYRTRFLYPRLANMLSGPVLDVGCGIGDFLEFSPGTVGVDINAANVEFCQARGVDARLMECGKIPFDSERFGSVVLDNVLEHIPEPDADRSLDEMMRVLRPGGTFLIGVPGRKGYASDPDHKKFYGQAELIELMADHGASLTALRRFPFWLPWIDRVLPQYCIYATFQKLDSGA